MRCGAARASGGAKVRARAWRAGSSIQPVRWMVGSKFIVPSGAPWRSRGGRPRARRAGPGGSRGDRLRRLEAVEDLIVGVVDGHDGALGVGMIWTRFRTQRPASLVKTDREAASNVNSPGAMDSPVLGSTRSPSAARTV